MTLAHLEVPTGGFLLAIGFEWPDEVQNLEFGRVRRVISMGHFSTSCMPCVVPRGYFLNYLAWALRQSLRDKSGRGTSETLALAVGDSLVGDLDERLIQREFLPKLQKSLLFALAAHEATHQVSLEVLDQGGIVLV